MRLGVQGENQVLDLVTLMSCPDDSQKFNKSLLRFLQSLAMALIKWKISSAKKKCKRRTPALKFIGRISLSRTASSNLMDNLSNTQDKHIRRKGATLTKTSTRHHFWERRTVPQNMKPSGGDHIHDEGNKGWRQLKKFKSFLNKRPLELIISFFKI